MNINNIHLHYVDTHGETVTPIKVDENSTHLKDYINSLVSEITSQSNKRNYKFKDGSTEVKSSLQHLISNSTSIPHIVLNNAKRLLEKEIKSQERMNRLDTKILKGSLLHLAFVFDNENHVIICKVEHDEILSEINFDLIRGLNTKKKVFKAILIVCDDNAQVLTNHVLDKNNSKYWWDDFLELEEVSSDEENTELSLHEIDKELNKHKKAFYPDYLIVRNAVIGYYRTKEVLNYTEIIEDIFEKYDPVNPAFPKDKLISKLRDLPERKKFDTQFGIVKTKVNKRIKNNIKLANNLYLNIDDYVENLRNILEPIKDAQGNKYVRILSSDGYDTLKDLLRDESDT